MKQIKTEVKHSESKSAWNVVGTQLGEKYKIARIPHTPHTLPGITDRERAEALEYAKYISDCLNNYDKISELIKK